jgi:tRNA threonylcarbamoyladenosine biosynthesis protein TsaB
MRFSIGYRFEVVKILSLDTSTDACSVAILVGNSVLERCELAPRKHATIILPMIDTLLSEAGLSITQMDAIAFGRGPGAFTGIRTAVGIAQGIAFASDLPAVPISTLAALALGAVRETGHTHIAVTLDARMCEIYFGIYISSGRIVRVLGEECVCSPTVVHAPPGKWFGVGSGWKVYSNILSERLNISSWLDERLPLASNIARLAADPIYHVDWVAAEQALPIYLRNRPE